MYRNGEALPEKVEETRETRGIFDGVTKVTWDLNIGTRI